MGEGKNTTDIFNHDNPVVKVLSEAGQAHMNVVRTASVLSLTNPPDTNPLTKLAKVSGDIVPESYLHAVLPLYDSVKDVPVLGQLLKATTQGLHEAAEGPHHGLSTDACKGSDVKR